MTLDLGERTARRAGPDGEDRAPVASRVRPPSWRDTRLLVGVVLGVWLVVAGGLFSSRTLTREALAAESALVVLLVCAWQLGEVFFTSCGFIALGLALRARFSQELDTARP